VVILSLSNQVPGSVFYVKHQFFMHGAMLKKYISVSASHKLDAVLDSCGQI
jgi:hypothetical protein